jgi:hypothetical protein
MSNLVAVEIVVTLFSLTLPQGVHLHAELLW